MQLCFPVTIDVAENTFNRLPKFVQNAVKIATAPIRSFISMVQKALDFLGRLMGARKKAASMPPMPSSDALSSSIPEYNPTSKSIPQLPFTSGYQETDFSEGNIGKYKGATSSSGIPEFPDGMSSRSYNIPSKSTDKIQMKKLAGGGVSFSNQSFSRAKAPKINMNMNVTQFEGNNYVTTQDLQTAVQESVGQTMNYLEAEGVRYDLGM